MKSKNYSLVGIIMGSKSDWKTMIHCSDTLKKFGIKHDVKVIKIIKQQRATRNSIVSARTGEMYIGNFINLAGVRSTNEFNQAPISITR